MSRSTDFGARGDELLDRAVEYFSGSFPNPSREACPHPDRIREMASSAELVTGELRKHLFQCSECFRDFRRERLAAAPLASPAIPLATRSILRMPARAIMTGVAASVVLAGGLGLFLWNRFEPHNQQQSRGADFRPSLDASSSLRSTGPAVGLPAIVAIQLQPSGVRRGIEASTESTLPAISVPAGPIRFDVKLPEDYPDGIYQVAIVGPFNDPDVESSAPAVAHSLVVSVDAVALRPGRRFLRIQQTGHPPDYVPILIERPTAR